MFCLPSGWAWCIMVLYKIKPYKTEVFLMLELGIKGSASIVVDESRLAKNVGSGKVALLSSPIMIALMEQATWTSVQEHLEDGMGTVGLLVNVKHVKPTPLGMKVTAFSELMEIRGKKLVFKVWAEDEQGLIGEGTHERAIVEEAPFEAKFY